MDSQGGGNVSFCPVENAAGIALGTCMVLDVRRNTWSQAASLPSPVSHASVAAVAEKVFILRQISSPPTFNNQFSVYDPSTNTRESRPHLPGNVSGNTEMACLVGVNNKVYVFGGGLRLALEYKPLSNQWVQLVPPNLRYVSHWGCCGVVMKSGNILICGGTTQGIKCDMIEEYNPSTKTWKTLDIYLPFKYQYPYTHVTSVRSQYVYG